jgi:hypothetical protein
MLPSRRHNSDDGGHPSAYNSFVLPA